MEMKNLELKKGYQQMPSHCAIAEFQFGNAKIKYTHVLNQLTLDRDRGLWTGYLIRTIEMPGENVIGKMIKTWVGSTALHEDELHELINKDREMLAKQILQEENNEEE
jgi:hypothetical protein|nr:MAG TPA: hypothetical protein [Crassvirales sp.]